MPLANYAMIEPEVAHFLKNLPCVKREIAPCLSL